ncbi:hypothetical protein MHYP_G00191460 [Metynnis hypsauchen]
MCRENAYKYRDVWAAVHGSLSCSVHRARGPLAFSTSSSSLPPLIRGGWRGSNSPLIDCNLVVATRPNAVPCGTNYVQSDLHHSPAPF